jgi:hypothetical protein
VQGPALGWTRRSGAQLDELLDEATEAIAQTVPNAPTIHEVSWSSGFVPGLRRARGIACGSGDDG